MAEIKAKIKEKITLRESISRIRKLVPLRHPLLIKDKTIECMEEVATNFDRKGPFIILFLITFTFSFKFASYIFRLATANSVGVPPQFIILTFFIIVPLLTGLLLWPINYIIWRILSLLIHFPCKYMGGGGTQKETQSVTGYALTPLVIGELVINILLIFLLSGSTVTTAVASAAMWEVLLILPFFAWTGAIAMIGLSKVHNIKYPISGGVSGAFIGFYLLFFVFPFLLVTG